MEEIRHLTLRELKQEIKENLEYAHPERDKNPEFSVAFGVNYGFKPIVNDIFFETDEEAVQYTFQTDTLYKNIQDSEDSTKIVEYYDEENEIQLYELYNKKNAFTVQHTLFHPQKNCDITYKFLFTKENFILSNTTMKNVICRAIKDSELVWDGTEMVEDIFSSDQIIYPANIRYLFEYLWFSWKNDKLDNKEAEKELISLMSWVDAMTKSKPTSKFWNQ